MDKKVGAVLLAAGSSRRMGRPKLLIGIGPEKRSVLEISLENHIAGSLDWIFVVVAGWLDELVARAEAYRSDRVRLVVMEAPCGMSDSLKAGWRRVQDEVGPDAVMISLADMPLVSCSNIDHMLEAYDAGTQPICVATCGGEWGHPVVIDSSLDDEIMALTGDRGAREILGRHRDSVLEVDMASPGVTCDVDRLDDIVELESRLMGHE